MTERDYKIFLDLPTLKTERLTLRRIKKSDLLDIYEYASSPLVSEYLLWSPHPNISHTKDYLSNLINKYKKGKIYDFGIEYEGKLIGTVGFSALDTTNNTAEIGYVLSDKYWGLGIGFEAAKKILDFGFRTLILQRIEARYMAENIKSKLLAQKLGMKEEGVLRSYIFCKGKYRDIGVSSILKEEFFRQEN